MSFKTFVASIFHSSVAQAAVEIALTPIQHAVAIAKADKGLVGKIEAQIEAAVSSNASGAEKRAAVVKALEADFVTFVGDPAASIEDVTDFAHEVVQSVYNDVKSVTAKVIAAVINAAFVKLSAAKAT